MCLLEPVKKNLQKQQINGLSDPGVFMEHAEICEFRPTSNAETQTDQTGVRHQSILAVQSNADVDQKVIQKLQGEVERATQIMDICYNEIEKDLREQEKKNSYLEDQVAALKEQHSSRMTGRWKMQERAESQCLLVNSQASMKTVTDNSPFITQNSMLPPASINSMWGV